MKNERIRLMLTDQFLRTEYTQNEKSIGKISKETGYSVGVIHKYIKKFGISTRKIGLFGNKNPNFGKNFSLETRKKMSIAKKGKLPAKFKGRKYNGSGYVLIYIPGHPFAINDNYVREHRLLLESHLDRHLKPNEVTHHLNEIKDDNVLGNLILFNSQSAHMRFEKGKNVELNEIVFDGRNL